MMGKRIVNDLRGCAIVITASLWVFAPIPALAQLFGQMPNPFGGQPSSAPGSVASVESSDDLNRDLSGLNGRFAYAMREMLTAQAYTLIALGDQSKADQLSSEAKTLEGANDLNTVSRCISDSEDASQEIDAKMSASAAIDAKSKQNLTLAVPHYGLGTVQAAHLPADYQAWVANARATVAGTSNNPLSMLAGGVGLSRSISDVADVTVRLPTLISTWADTTHNFIKFSRGNSVDTADLSSKI